MDNQSIPNGVTKGRQAAELAFDLLIKPDESFRSHAYLDKVAVTQIWSIRYGRTGLDVIKDSVTTESVEREWSVSNLEGLINRNLIRFFLLTPAQLGALASLVYNIGEGKDGWRGSTLKSLLEQTITEEALLEKWWKCWNKTGGKIINGLINRRADEWNVFKADLPQYETAKAALYVKPARTTSSEVDCQAEGDPLSQVIASQSEEQGEVTESSSSMDV